MLQTISWGSGITEQCFMPSLCFVMCKLNANPLQAQNRLTGSMEVTRTSKVA